MPIIATKYFICDFVNDAMWLITYKFKVKAAGKLFNNKIYLSIINLCPQMKKNHNYYTIGIWMTSFSGLLHYWTSINLQNNFRHNTQYLMYNYLFWTTIYWTIDGSNIEFIVYTLESVKSSIQYVLYRSAACRNISRQPYNIVISF